jgi:tetratricopeptide (TPR) repeat protein
MALKERALCKMNLKKFSGAISDINEAIKLKPEYTELYYARSLIHLNNKEYDDAITWAKKGLQLKPQNEALMINMMMANFLKKNYAEVYRNWILQTPMLTEQWPYTYWLITKMIRPVSSLKRP